MTPIELILMALIGIETGIVTGLTGASGVMDVIPLLSMLLGFGMKECIAISLFVDALVSLSISYTYYKHGNIDLKSGMWLSLGTIIGTQVGAGLISGVHDSTLSSVMVVMLIGMGYVMYSKGLHREQMAGMFNQKVNMGANTRTIVSVILGVLMGFMTIVLGAGGGMIMLLVLLVVYDLSLHKAIGTSTLMMGIASLVFQNIF